MSIKLKLEAFVKEKIQPRIEKTMTVTPANYSINPSQTATSTTTLNIPLSSSKMSTTIFQPVNPQQLSQYCLRPSNNTPTPPPVTNQKQVVSTSSRSVVVFFNCCTASNIGSCRTYCLTTKTNGSLN
uniref:Uncharacterized protein n=1 Tax=Meloidogyne enterolobii TaxID=390850 RepID=A0A6V7XYN6_MELEN|nr:unnamed protein product [Meloidogyne enterolobii]